MESRTYILSHDTARQRAADDVKTAPVGWAVKVSEPTRNLEQNAAMWRILDCFSKQKQWPVNGELVWMDADDWKNVLSAAFRKETVRMTQGIDGGFVMLGQRTSKFSKREFSEFIEFLNATAAHYLIDIK